MQCDTDPTLSDYYFVLFLFYLIIYWDESQLLSCARVDYKLIYICHPWAGDRNNAATKQNTVTIQQQQQQDSMLKQHRNNKILDSRFHFLHLCFAIATFQNVFTKQNKT